LSAASRRFTGSPVGIVANNGILFFRIRHQRPRILLMCANRKIPLVFLQNITGFMSQKIRVRRHRPPRCENGHGVSTAAVPKFTVIIGGSFGAGNYGMCGAPTIRASLDVA